MNAQILVVEDDPGIRDALRELLQIEGFGVATAENGAQALQLLDDALPSPCLILLDLMMPVMDGWTFLEHLKRHPGDRRAALPVAVVSAASDLTGVTERYGCDVLRKPIDLDRLLDVARQHCGCSDPQGAVTGAYSAS